MIARSLSLFLLICLALPALAQDAKETKERSVKEILDHVDDLFRGQSSHGKMTMKVVTSHWTRELTLESWSLGKEHSLITILEPRKEKGTATLKAGNNIWNYLPKVKRVIKVPSSMMGGSWMGSHFTNDDLIKESRMAEDYVAEKTFEGDRGGQRVMELTLKPKPNAPVVWGKVVVTVREADLMPQEIHYHDEDMKLARTMNFSDIKALGGRTLPGRMKMVPSDKPQESTEIVYHSIEFDMPLKESMFSLRNLQSGAIQ